MTATNSRFARVGPVPVERDVLAELRELAPRHGRTLNGEIRYALRLYADTCRRREQPSAASRPAAPA